MNEWQQHRKCIESFRVHRKKDEQNNKFTSDSIYNSTNIFVLQVVYSIWIFVSIFFFFNILVFITLSMKCLQEKKNQLMNV